MDKHSEKSTIIFFPFLQGIKDLLSSSDAHIVSLEGEAVLRDKDKMEKVEEAIKASKENDAHSKSIIVKF